MKPIKFDESNANLARPSDMTDEQCQSLPIVRVQYPEWVTCVSCWQMSWRDRLKLLVTGKVWLGVIGHTQPPVFIEADKPFKIEQL